MGMLFNDLALKEVEQREAKNPKSKGKSNSIFPKVGEATQDFEKRYGDITITELQLPEIKDWKQGVAYTLTVTAIMTRSEIKQDTKHDDKKHIEIATSEPYISARFEIKDIKAS